MRDPICGMDVSEPPKIRLEKDGAVYGFCSERCREAFRSGQAPRPMQSQPSSLNGYLILAGVFAAITAFTLLRRFGAGDGSAHEAMADFMGAFFFVFGCFKMLDLSAFADAYQTYDLLARKSRPYALAYPFIQVLLGVAFVSRWRLELVSVFSLLIMSVSAVGVARALLSKQKIRCACLGTKIALPMSTISLLEDTVMALMALGMLIPV